MAVALTLIAVALIVYFNFIRPAYQEDQTIKAQAASRQNFIEGQKAAIAKVDDLINSYKGEGQLQDLVSLVLPLGPDLAGAFAQINGLAQNNRLTIQDISVSLPGLQNLPQKPVEGRAPSGVSPPVIKPFGLVAVRVKAVGSYEDFKSFLKNFESNIRIFDIKKIAFQPANKPDQDSYIYDLTLNTYYQGH